MSADVRTSERRWQRRLNELAETPLAPGAKPPSVGAYRQVEAICLAFDAGNFDTDGLRIFRLENGSLEVVRRVGTLRYTAVFDGSTSASFRLSKP